MNALHWIAARSRVELLFGSIAALIVVGCVWEVIAFLYAWSHVRKFRGVDAIARAVRKRQREQIEQERTKQQRTTAVAIERLEPDGMGGLAMRRRIRHIVLSELEGDQRHHDATMKRKRRGGALLAVLCAIVVMIVLVVLPLRWLYALSWTEAFFAGVMCGLVIGVYDRVRRSPWRGL